MKEIRHKIGELEVFQKADNGYINATQLCKAYFHKTGTKKSPAHWFETNRANAFIELVSSDIGIPISQLFVVQKGNSLRYNQGTWMHPDLATPFASWLSPEFELKVSRWVQKWMETGQNPIQTNQSKPAIIPIEPTIEEINLVFSGLNRLNINPGLVESAKLTAVAVAIPRLSKVAEEGKRLLSSQMSLKEMPVSPTKIGELIVQKYRLTSTISAQKVNQALEKAGLQHKKLQQSGKRKPNFIWELTQIGHEFGQIQMDTAKNHGKTVFAIRWFTRVIPLIQGYFV